MLRSKESSVADTNLFFDDYLLTFFSTYSSKEYITFLASN